MFQCTTTVLYILYHHYIQTHNVHKKKDLDDNASLGKLIYGTSTSFNTNKYCGISLEDTVKVYALGIGSPYNKVKVYTPIGDSTRYYM